ncbi:MAG: ATPase, T2SS/T4P/T4SS family [Candidatus Micrarchaeaceae archaeon]
MEAEGTYGKEEEKEELLGEYDLNAHGMKVHVRLTQGTDFMPLYNLTYPGLGEATKLLLMSFRKELMAMVPIDPSRIENKEYVEEINNKYIAASNLLIDKYLPGTSGETKQVLISYILNMMLGLGDLEGPLADDNLEEVTVNGSKSFIFVFHKVYGWCKTNIRPLNEDVIYEQAEQIGRRVGREINNLAPLMDAELPDGSRVNATLYPVSQNGNTITIRKFAKNPWTMPALIKNHTISYEIAALVWLSIQNEISMLFSGGTASGKTSFLNASSIFFPASRRIISMEETRELTLPSFLQWIPMLSRQPNPEGKGEVSLYNLMVNALRQRPDIVVVGEIRTQKDAETLFEAIHTGHAVYGTVHADNAQDTIIRMTNPPIDIPKIMLNALGGIVVLFRHRSRGIRRVLEFGEVLRDGDVNVLYKWNMRDDTFSHINDMSRLMETLNLYGGLTRSEINDEIAEKSKVLEWMVKNDILEVNDAGLVVANYYKHKERILDIVNSDVKYDRKMFR